MAAPLRVRHGVIADPLFGYRAIREIDGQREFIGPWTTETRADEIAAAAAEALHALIDEHGATRVTGDTPLNIWQPASDGAR